MSSDLKKKETDFFLIKSIRQYPDPYAFWRHEAISLTLTDESPDYERNRPLRFGGEKKPYTLRIDGPQKVKDKPLYNKYDEHQKRWSYSKHKSLTAVKERKFCPPAFSFNKPDPDSVEVGYMLPAKPAYARPRRILQGGGGTIHRNFRYETEAEAERAWNNGLWSRIIFRNLNELAQHAKPKEFNEVMAHVKWGPEARIAYFKDNLNSKLRAISLAHDMSVRLHAQQIKSKSGEDSKSLIPSDSKELPHVPIYSYLPKKGNKAADIAPYEKQEEDINLGLESKDIKTRAFARFIRLQKNNFVKKEKDEYSAEELEIFIKIAADLTYESSIYFFKNFFLPNQELISQKLEKKPYLLRDIFRCVPLDKRSELIYPLLTTPESRGYYLHSLLKFDCLEHDIEEFFKQVESTKEINFEVVGEYKPANRQWKIAEVQDRNANTPLHLAAARNKLVAAAKLLQNKEFIDAQNKDDLTPLDLAFEAGHIEMVTFLMKQGGSVTKPQSLLHLAAKQGNYALVENLVNVEKAHINCKDFEGRTPLHLAAQEGRFEVVEFLIKTDPTILHIEDNRGLTAFHHAISSNSSKTLESLIEKKGQIDRSPRNFLNHAISNNRLDIAKLLIEKRLADVNSGDNLSRTPLSYAVRENKLVAVDLLLEHRGTYIRETEDGRDSFNQAVASKNWAVVDFLLTQETISFSSLLSDSLKRWIGLDAIVLTAWIIEYPVFKTVDPLGIENFDAAYIDLGNFILLLVLFIMNAICFPNKDLLSARSGYEAIQKHIEDREKTVLARTEALQRLGVSEPSVAAVLQHFDSLSLNQQAAKLIQIANVDAKLSLYVIIRLFNSDVERASNILAKMSNLPKEDCQSFCGLFENPTSDELEVIVGCVAQKIRKTEKDEAFDILKIFSKPTQEKILARLDPIHKLHFTLQSSPVSDQKLRVNIDTMEVKDRKQYSPTSSALNRETFFYYDENIDVKHKKVPEFKDTSVSMIDADVDFLLG